MKQHFAISYLQNVKVVIANLLNQKSNKILEETKQMIDKLLLDEISLVRITQSQEFLKDGVEQHTALYSISA